LSFGGGGASGGKTKAHTHNSTISDDGGALSSTLTQLDTSTLYTRIIIGV
tara:strand:+ start:161 stop:310 length:150 start_codon:yes stop_codon:yes gene_type:complete